MARLTTIIEGLHAKGYLHNDLHEAQVAVEFVGGEVDVTLLDLGKVRKIGGRPFIENAIKCKTNRDIRRLCAE